MITVFIIAEYTSITKRGKKWITTEEGYSKAYPSTQYKRALNNAIWNGAYAHIAHGGNYDNWTPKVLSKRVSYIGEKNTKVSRKKLNSVEKNFIETREDDRKEVVLDTRKKIYRRDYTKRKTISRTRGGERVKYQSKDDEYKEYQRLKKKYENKK